MQDLKVLSTTQSHPTLLWDSPLRKELCGQRATTVVVPEPREREMAEQWPAVRLPAAVCSWGEPSVLVTCPLPGLVHFQGSLLPSHFETLTQPALEPHVAGREGLGRGTACTFILGLDI